jgi:hypothetical protein
MQQQSGVVGLVAHPPPTPLFLPRPPIVFLTTFRLATTSPSPPHHLSVRVFPSSIFSPFEAQSIAYYALARLPETRYSPYLLLRSVSQAPKAATEAGAFRVRPLSHCAIPAPAASQVPSSFIRMRARLCHLLIRLRR